MGDRTVKKRVLFAGLSGGMVMLTWLFVSNAMLPFKSNLIHGVLPLQDQLGILRRKMGWSAVKQLFRFGT